MTQQPDITVTMTWNRELIPTFPNALKTLGNAMTASTASLPAYIQTPKNLNEEILYLLAKSQNYDLMHVSPGTYYWMRPNRQAPIKLEIEKDSIALSPTSIEMDPYASTDTIRISLHDSDIESKSQQAVKAIDEIKVGWKRAE